jgi:probable F420-dependent oxidoreductase
MKYGVILPNYGPQAGRLPTLDTAQTTESLGFDSAWVTDHVALPEADSPRYTPIFEALTTLGYLAASTRRVRLGVSALVLPQRSPVEVAKEIATLDVLSGGRMMLAVGIGWSAGEYANLGHTFTDRGRRMDEAIRVLRTLWRGGKVISFQGKYYPLDKMAFSPGPVQLGGPPLWVAGVSPRALRRAALLADGWHPTELPAADLAAMLRVVRPLLAERPFTVSMRMGISFGESRPGRALTGSPAQIIAALQAYAQAGMSYAVLDFQAESQAERERAMRLFVQEVIPMVG